MHIRLLEKICRELLQTDNCLNVKLKLSKLLRFLWVLSEHLPADINSKQAKTFSLDLFLHGPPLFKQDDLSDHVYATFVQGKFETGKQLKFWNKNGSLSVFVRPVYLGDHSFVQKAFKQAAASRNNIILPPFEIQLLSSSMSLWD